METKHLTLSLKAEGDEGVITGYGSVFGNEDSCGDIVERGAFAETLTKRMPKMLWQHDMRDLVGRWTEAREDARGLYLSGKISTKTTRGGDCYQLVKDGALDGLSIGYRVTDYEMRGDTRLIRGVDLYEVSFVTMPANDLATVTGVKAAEMTVRQLEADLRARYDLSQRDAKASASFIKRLRDDQRDADDAFSQEFQRDAEALKTSLKKLI